MNGKSYQIALAQLKEQGLQHPDSHMDFNHLVSETPTDVSMTQMSMNKGVET